VASLTERYQAPTRVLETHPGGGQYDCISLYWPGRSWTGQHIDLNREGSAHILGDEELHSLGDTTA
jgi:hypothetical protein